MKLSKQREKEIIMNFKSLTKIATAALLFASTSAFAQEGSVYLDIINNTNYDFNIKQNESTLDDTIKAHSERNFTQLPLALEEPESIWPGNFANFDLTSGDIILRVLISTDSERTRAIAIFRNLSAQEEKRVEKSLRGLEYSADYEYHVFLTLAGNKENNFAGSSLKLEVVLKPEQERKQKETSRLEQRLLGHPEEKLLQERLLQMKRQ
jgi:hypothetical protein